MRALVFALFVAAAALASSSTPQDLQTAGTEVQDWKTNTVSPHDQLAAKELGIDDEAAAAAAEQEKAAAQEQATHEEVATTPAPTPTPTFDAIAHQKKLDQILEKMEEEERMRNNCVGKVEPKIEVTKQEWVPIAEGPVVPPVIPSHTIEVPERDLLRGCTQHRTCELCLGLDHQSGGSGCGWCADTKLCMAGTAEGPLGNPRSFNCTHWDFGFCSGEPCDAYKSCFQCVRDPFCGWCAESATCQEGTNAGPLFGWCETWQPHTADVPGEQCGAIRELFPHTHVITATPEPQVMHYEGV